MEANSGLDFLMEGMIPQWNSWREKNPDAEIDLSGYDLEGIDFTGANLREVNLSGTKGDFRRADTTNAIFNGVVIPRFRMVEQLEINPTRATFEKIPRGTIINLDVNGESFNGPYLGCDQNGVYVSYDREINVGTPVSFDDSGNKHFTNFAPSEEERRKSRCIPFSNIYRVTWEDVEKQ